MSGQTRKNDVDERKEGIGQGELYSPDHAIKINTRQNNINNLVEEGNSSNQHNQQEEKGQTMVGRGVATDIKNRMSVVKERVMEKLAAASVPSEALENARSFLESMIKDVTSAAHGITKEALQRIKSHLADILPSLSPSLTSKMVDEAEKEAGGESDDHNVNRDQMEEKNNEQQKGKAYASSASSHFFSYLTKPVAKL